MFDPAVAKSLIEAGAWVILVVSVVTIAIAGAREVWVWGSTLRRALADVAALRAENAELRTEIGANTKAMGLMSADFVKALGELRAGFERELEDLTDELRWDNRERHGARTAGGSDAG